MTQCHCEACCDDPLPTYGYAHQLESEARFVLAMDLDARRRYLKRIEKRSGADRRIKLQEVMTRLFEAKKGQRKGE